MTVQGTRERSGSRRTGPPATTGTPRSVTAAALLAALAALAAAADAIAMLVEGKSMLRDMADSLLPSDTAGLSKSDFQPLIDDAVDAAYKTLQGRAYVLIVAAIVCLALVRPIRRGANKARIAMSVFVLLPCFMEVRDLTDTTPTLFHTLDGVGLACAVALLVAMWLPSTSAYVKAR